MLSFAALSINRFFTPAPKVKRETPGSRTETLRALSDLGESIASGVHAIYAQSRLYLCVAMQPKPEALSAQKLADKKAAAGHFDVDENWSAAEVNARWGKRAVLTDENGRVLDGAVLGARGMTDVGGFLRVQRAGSLSGDDVSGRGRRKGQSQIKSERNERAAQVNLRGAFVFTKEREGDIGG